MERVPLGHFKMTSSKTKVLAYKVISLNGYISLGGSHKDESIINFTKMCTQKALRRELVSYRIFVLLDLRSFRMKPSNIYLN